MENNSDIMSKTTTKMRDVLEASLEYDEFQNQIRALEENIEKYKRETTNHEITDFVANIRIGKTHQKIGSMFLNSKFMNVEKAVFHFRTSAEDYKDISSYKLLGDLFSALLQNDDENQMNFENSVKYYSLALVNGDPSGELNKELGSLYHYYPSFEDFEKAEKFYLAAVNKGNSIAHTKLLQLVHYSSKGIFQSTNNYVKEVKYSFLASKVGNSIDYKYLASIYRSYEKNEAHWQGERGEAENLVHMMLGQILLQQNFSLRNPGSEDEDTDD
jgi:tetratricopeptide (TPR) repeat protein